MLYVVETVVLGPKRDIFVKFADNPKKFQDKTIR